MKKIIFFIPVAILVVPSFAFASWWNPFTWIIFNHSNTTPAVTQSVDNQNGDQDVRPASTTPKVIVFGSDDSIKSGQVLTPQQKVVRQIITKVASSSSGTSASTSPKYVKPDIKTTNQNSQKAPISPDTVLKAQLNMIRVAAENYYNSSSSYSGFCTFDKNYQNINLYLQTSQYKYVLVCNADKNTYAVSSTLVSGGYWCVDSTGSTGKIDAQITKTSCGVIKTDDASTRVSGVNPTADTNSPIRVPTIDSVPMTVQSQSVSESNTKPEIKFPTASSILKAGQAYAITWTNENVDNRNFAVYLTGPTSVDMKNPVYLGTVNASQQTFIFKVPTNVELLGQRMIVMYLTGSTVASHSEVFTIQ